MSRPRLFAFTIVLALGSTPAFADITAFIGPTTTPTSRTTEGVAAGVSLAVVGFEFEYAATSDDAAKGAPALKTGMVNGFVQTPFPLLRLQPYATIGTGIYRETLGQHQDTGVGVNVGGGVKFSLVGPLQVRGDYRIFKLGSGALTSPAHRFYIGLNLKF